MKNQFSGGRLVDLCPRCSAPGPFRAPSADEAAAIQPERWHWWIVAPASVIVAGSIGVLLMVMLQ